MFRNRDAVATSEARTLALDCLTAGIEAADPELATRNALALCNESLQIDNRHVSLSSYDRILVVGGGKAAVGVATALETILGDSLDDGVIVTDSPQSLDRLTVVQGRHPVPDTGGVEGTRSMLTMADSAGEETLIIAVITGGGSALLPAPAGSISLDDVQAVTQQLLEAGAPISDLNAVRKHISDIKGGRLAERASPADIIGLVISDVVGNDLSVIASGPITPDQTTYQDAISALERHDVTVPPQIRSHLEAGVTGEHPETPSAGTPIFDRVSTHIIADNRTAIDAARSVASEAGYATTVLSSQIEGEARDVGRFHAAIALEGVQQANPVDPPAVILSGGETTVTVRGDGDGGPNQEFVVGAALTLANAESGGATIASVDTDGIDGASDAAGGLIDETTVDDRQAAQKALEANNAGPYLDERAGRLLTGATGTNVNDLRVMVLQSGSPSDS